MYDVVIIGGGSGGYTAAIRGAQRGLKVLLVEKDALGGTCLHRGCIPTKSYIYATKTLESARQAEFLSGNGRLSLNLAKMVARKQEIVNKLTNGLEAIFRSHSIEIVNGVGNLLGPGRVLVSSEGGSSREIAAKNIVIATGSRPAVPPFIKVDGNVVQTTDQALDPETVPKKLAIIGGGVIGIEMASIYRRLGSDVVILELLPDILITEDPEIRRLMRMLAEQNGIKLHLEAKVHQVTVSGPKAILEWEDKSGRITNVKIDRVLVATGRAPLLLGVDAGRLNLNMNGGFIEVNALSATNLPNVWAIGDVVGGMMLAHKASAEAEAVVDNMLGGNKKVCSRFIPSCIWGFTEIGSVGWSEEEAAGQGHTIRVSRFPYSYNGAAQALGETHGLVKIIGDAQTGEILGVHIIGSYATDLISEAVAVMTMEGTVEDLAEAIHPHPTLSESILEAALNWNNLAIHVPKQ